MKDYAANKIRNFALVGHGSSGKTMLSEAMLLKSGEINRLGSIEAGSTVSDYHHDEHDRQISIHSSPLHLEWNETKFNLIDTPGYLDFIGETISSLAVVDAAIIVIHAVNGIEVGTEQVWNYSSDFGLPKTLVINGLDRENTKFDEILKQAKKHFGSNVFPMQLPVNAGPGFNQIIDVLRSELITYSTDGSGKFKEEKLPDEWKSQVKKLHQELIEYVAESDDSLLEKFFDQGNLSEEEMREGLHHAIQNQILIPLFCTSANLNIDTGLLTGDRSIKPDSELIVATTEILRNMIYSNDERLKQIGLIVLDEVHYLSDSERGTTWEEIIIHAPKNIKFLFLSATIRNKEEFHNWIVSLRGKTALVYSNIRPVPLEISLVGLNPHNDQLKIIKSSKDKRNNKIFKFEKQYRKYKRPHLGFQLDYLDNKQLTPSIFFYFSRDRVETKARQATTNRKKIKEAEEVRKLFNNVFDSLDPVEYELLNLDELLWMWVRGVGYHHAGLAPIVKEFIEYLFLNRFIKYLFATETLSLGLNLPAKSIVIDRLYKFDGVKTRLINQSEFLQLTGRAGRRGIDTKGFAFINYDRNIENFWYNNLFTLKSSNLNSAYSVSYSSILNMLSKYSLNEAVELLENSFFAYQNNFNIKNLKKTFTSKLEVLELLKFKDNNKKSIVLTETYRDNLIVGLELLENEFNKDMNFYLMLVCSGLSTTRQVLSLNDIYMDTYVKFQIMEEKINKMESFAGVKNTTSIEIGWFSIFNEYLHSQDIELVLTKFNISIGDFIRAGKEASELSTKLFNIYKLKEFKIISDMFSNELIQKTMR